MRSLDEHDHQAERLFAMVRNEDPDAEVIDAIAAALRSASAEARFAARARAWMRRNREIIRFNIKAGAGARTNKGLDAFSPSRMRRSRPVTDRIVFLRVEASVDGDHVERCGDCSFLYIPHRPESACQCEAFHRDLVSVPSGVGTYELRTKECLESESARDGGEESR